MLTLFDNYKFIIRRIKEEEVVDNFDMLINNLYIIFYNKLLLKKNEDYEKQKKMPK